MLITIVIPSDCDFNQDERSLIARSIFMSAWLRFVEVCATKPVMLRYQYAAADINADGTLFARAYKFDINGEVDSPKMPAQSIVFVGPEFSAALDAIEDAIGYVDSDTMNPYEIVVAKYIVDIPDEFESVSFSTYTLPSTYRSAGYTSDLELAAVYISTHQPEVLH